jgi:hypothetical protein
MDQLIKRIIMEQTDEKAFNPMEVRLFKFINKFKKELGTQSKLVEFLRNSLKTFNIPIDKANEYYYIYTLNFRPSGDYENVTKSEFKDPKIYSKQSKIVNSNAGELTKSKIPFKGSNLEGMWKLENDNEWVYIVKSYAWYPIFAFKYGKWFEVDKTYSSSTAKQMRHSNPVRYNSNIKEEVIVVSPSEMDNIIRGSISVENLIKNKESLFLTKVKQQIKLKKPLFFVSGWYDNKAKVTFIITQVSVKNGIPSVTVKITDVNKMNDRKVIKDDGSFFRGEMEGITEDKIREDVERAFNQTFSFLLGKESAVKVNVVFEYTQTGTPTSLNTVSSFLRSGY